MRLHMVILNDIPEIFSTKWQMCRKRVYSVKAMRNASITSVYNFLERSTVAVKPNDIIIEGMLGERYVISAERFLARYVHTDGSDLSDIVNLESFDWIEVNTKAVETVNYCLFIPKANQCGVYGMPTKDENKIVYRDKNGNGYQTLFQVNSPQSMSDHGNGDYLLCDSVNKEFPDMWVVDGAVFEKTYKLIK